MATSCLGSARASWLVGFIALALVSCGSEEIKDRAKAQPEGQPSPTPVSQRLTGDGGLKLQGKWKTKCIADNEGYSPYQINLTFANGTMTYEITSYWGNDGGLQCDSGYVRSTTKLEYDYGVGGDAPGEAGAKIVDFYGKNGSNDEYNIIRVRPYSVFGYDFSDLTLGDIYTDESVDGSEPNARAKTLYSKEIFTRAY